MELRPGKMQELKNPETDTFKDIRPRQEKTAQDRLNQFNEMFIKSEWGGDYTTYNERLSRTLKNDTFLGQYEGERGESKFIPSDATEAGRKALEKLSEYGTNGVEYKNAEVDFSKCSEATVKIDKMTDNMANYRDEDGDICLGNFAQADIKCAELWSKECKDGKNDWTPEDVENWRKEHNCSWHERCDTKTMDLVPREIHDFFKHSGGRAECRLRDSVNQGGIFDGENKN